LISLAVYHVLAFQVIKKRSLVLKEYFSTNAEAQLNWVRYFTRYSFIVCLLVVTALYLLYINYPAGYQYRFAFVGLSIFIYWTSYTALTQPLVFSVIKGNNDETHGSLPKLTVQMPVKKYANSTLDEIEKQRICAALDSLIRNENVYLDAELTIDVLAEKASCTRHALSQVLNECVKQSFYDYINYHRVEAAKILLADESRAGHKIASIAYDAGFNSISTFNEVFKKSTGCTPSQFRRKPVPQLMEQRV
jgi:AraC-like DNA-binding protein